jgi:hypothetical protein
VTGQAARTDFALNLRSVASAVMAERGHATPLVMQAALLLDVLARVTAREGADLDDELAGRALAVASAALAELNHRKTTRADDDPHAMTSFATLYTEASAGYPTPEAVEDIDQAVLVLARHVTGVLSPLGAPRPYPVATLARTTTVIVELVADLAARSAAVAGTIHGHSVLPAGVPGALRHVEPGHDPSAAVDAAQRWLNFAADELADLAESVRTAERALALLNHEPTPAARHDMDGATTR